MFALNFYRNSEISVVFVLVVRFDIILKKFSGDWTNSCVVVAWRKNRKLEIQKFIKILKKFICIEKKTNEFISYKKKKVPRLFYKKNVIYNSLLIFLALFWFKIYIFRICSWYLFQISIRSRSVNIFYWILI